MLVKGAPGALCMAQSWMLFYVWQCCVLFCIVLWYIQNPCTFLGNEGNGTIVWGILTRIRDASCKPLHVRERLYISWASVTKLCYQVTEKNKEAVTQTIDHPVGWRIHLSPVFNELMSCLKALTIWQYPFSVDKYILTHRFNEVFP